MKPPFIFFGCGCPISKNSLLSSVARRQGVFKAFTAAKDQKTTKTTQRIIYQAASKSLQQI
jgi:hypothetical protein